jgi:hypothetical protein
MADPIEAHYTPDGDDWTVAVTGRGRTLTGRAPGLIAARDRADQLVEQLAPEETGHKTVVHMLNGDAVEFTTAYLTARLARTEEPAEGKPADTSSTEPADTEAPAKGETREVPAAVERPADAKPSPTPRPKPTPAPRTESEAATPAVHPPAAGAQKEETATSGS